jgi:hypothetical protein
MRKTIGFGLALALLAALVEFAGPLRDVAAAASQSPQGTVTTGEVSGTNCGVVTACTSGLKVNFNPQMCGAVTAADGSRWDVPAAVHAGPAAVDVYNDCTGPRDIPDYLAQVKTVVVDPDGVEITGYVFADNYYELYVNGTFIAKDGMGMTPFNSTVVRFRYWTEGYAFAFSPDSRYLAILTDTHVNILNARTGDILLAIEDARFPQDEYTLQWSGDGTHLAIGGEGVVSVWEVGTLHPHND